MYPEIEDYKLLYFFTLELFEQAIKEHIKQGYTLYHGPFEWHSKICQAMVRYKPLKAQVYSMPCSNSEIAA